MSTRKDFQAAADAIMEARPERDPNVKMRAFDVGRMFACDEIAEALAVTFKADNPRFQKEKFLRAAGVKKD